MGQPVVHFEVMGQDGEKLRSYYSELFGWKIDAGNPMGYGIVSREENLGPDGEGIAGGVGQVPEGQPGAQHLLRRGPRRGGRAGKGGEPRRDAGHGSRGDHGQHRDRPLQRPRGQSRGSGPDVVEEAEFWGEDPQLVALLGDQGATGFRAVFDAFPEAVGVLWALRDAEGRVADFAFGYGNPAILRGFRLPPATRDRYTLLEALPQMRGSRAFRAYVGVCDSGEPWVQEVTYDTPFGDGYMLGTFVQRIAKLGDGLVVFLTDVTEQRRMEADLRSYADVVAHDLREPVAGMALLVSLLERRAAEPPRPTS